MRGTVKATADRRGPNAQTDAPAAAPQSETPQEWLARVLVEHGPPPQRAFDLWHSHKAAAAADAAVLAPARVAGGRS